MVPQWSNLAISSFLLYLDNQILTRGKAFTNTNSKLYPSQNVYNGYYQYNFPFSQLVNDISVPSANVISGLYLNSVFAPVGTSGLVSINHNKGQAYFSTGLSNSIQVSGQYSVKDVNVSMTNFPDIKVLFETKLNQRNKVTQNANNYTGIENNEISFPVIFIRQDGGKSEPYAFGGLKETTSHIGCFVFTDSIFLHDATLSILNDLKHEYVPIITTGETPFNNLGGFKNNIPYNYTGITYNKVNHGSGIFINDVIITDFTKRGLFQEVQALTSECYVGIAEFELIMPRLT